MPDVAVRRSYVPSLLIFAALFALGAAPPRPQSSPRINDTDRVRIREAFRLATAIGDRVWPSWHDAPFALILVTPDYEFLVHHTNPSADFTRIDSDTLV
ncbi:MAG TPA: hypothetical protein VGQ30_08365, partial [Gemmatimonadaceae bacterium]|nr:hypothetical protein [Gemmatimonadaceae bacterium]